LLKIEKKKFVKLIYFKFRFHEKSTTILPPQYYPPLPKILSTFKKKKERKIQLEKMMGFFIKIKYSSIDTNNCSNYYYYYYLQQPIILTKKIREIAINFMKKQQLSLSISYYSFLVIYFLYLDLKIKKLLDFFL